MPKIGGNPESLVPFKKGEDNRREGNGHKKGQRNRSTIAREILELTAKFPEKVFIKLLEQYPKLTK